MSSKLFSSIRHLAGIAPTTQASPSIDTTVGSGLIAKGLALDIRLSYADFQLALCCTIAATGVTAIFGRSGCGKTSLLRVIAGLEPRVRGQISFAGTLWLDGNTQYPVTQRRIGLVSQHDTLMPHLNVEQNLLFGYQRRTLAERSLSPAEIYQRLDLTPLLKRKVQQLSGGQKQRVALGRALLAQPQLLLLDEPFSALDQQGRQEILPYLQKLLQDIDIPVLFVSHQLEDVVQLADDMLLLANGKVQAQGPLTELLHQEPLLQHEALSLLYARAQPLAATPAGYCQLVLGNNSILLPSQNGPAPNQTKCRLKVRARDVSVSLQPLLHSSIQLQLPATVRHWKNGSQSTDVLLYLQLDDGQMLTALISSLAFHQLALRQGSALYANIKVAAFG